MFDLFKLAGEKIVILILHDLFHDCFFNHAEGTAQNQHSGRNILRYILRVRSAGRNNGNYFMDGRIDRLDLIRPAQLLGGK